MISHNRPFSHQIRVYYADTDAGGIVYHARYLEFAERCRSELLRAIGEPLVTEDGRQFIVRRSQIEWHAPARLDDLLTCEATVLVAKGARVVMQQRVLRGEQILTTIDVELAYVSASHRPARLGAQLVEALTRFSQAVQTP